MKYHLVIIICFCTLDCIAQDISINEFMPQNEATLQDEDGDYSDWLELYNASNTTVNLSGWFLSDDADAPLKWQLSQAEIGPFEFLVVFASSKDRTGPGELHANFKISSDGEILLLSAPDGSLVQAISPVALSADISFGSITDGLFENQVPFGQSTPGQSNANGEVVTLFSDNISFSRPAGFYSEKVDLELTSLQGGEIRYTLDGSSPTFNSMLYVQPLEILDRAGEPNGISLIDTGTNWQEPRTTVEKATVVKAASFVGDVQVSTVKTETYFISSRINEKYEGLPVVSISIHADSLFSDERGIYVKGIGGLGNYRESGQDWEREMHFEYFDEQHEKKIGQNVGGRIHGNSSRGHPQKTLRLYARNDYGESHFDYRFFEEKDIDRFKRILIRSSSTDFGNTMFKDILCSRLVEDLDVDYMAAEVCVVFINGEYWGVQSVRERIDKHFLSDNHGVDSDSLDLLTLNAEVEEGDDESYFNFLDYVRNHDLSVD